MSTAAVKNFPVVSGSSAPAIRSLPSGPGRRERTPLSVVRSAPKKRRAPFVVMCFALLAVALVAVLVLNISVSTSQYQLVELRGKQSTLTKQNQDLTQQVQNFEAPQNLAAKASDLGMVASTVKGQIDLSTLAVTGKATPAVKGGAAGAVIPAPAVEGVLTVVPPATKWEPLTNRKPAPEEPAPAAAPAAAAPRAEAPAPPAPAVELHGGSVPAPEQKVPGV
ncbi:UNVERIFIED_ORG: cell division protein FtsL [Arthrobacter sp. UYCu721]